VYRDGLVNANREAINVLKKAADSLLLLAPTSNNPHWLLLPAMDGIAGEIKLIGRADRTRYLRFRARTLALALFAAVPSEKDSIRMKMEPCGASGWKLVAQ